MSDFYRDATRPHARRRYVCVACGWFIAQGEQHMHQTGVYDGSYFSSRYHDECWDYLADDEFADEFVTGDVPVPERLKAEADAHFADKNAEVIAALSDRAVASQGGSVAGEGAEHG